MRVSFTGIVIAFALADASRIREAQLATANPIRKVVTLLQKIQEKVTLEGEQELANYKKFVCYCKKGGGDLKGSIAGAETKIPQVSANIQSGEEEAARLKADLKGGKEGRAAAKGAMNEATALREKEAAAFAKEKHESETNIAAIKKAVAALEKGAAGSFVQTSAARVIQRLALDREDMLDSDRRAVLAFLSGSQGSGYVPQSGEITGILKELGDTMAKGLAAAVAAEEAAIQSYTDLMTAKKKEIRAITEAIEEKTTRAGEVAVELVNLKNDLSETQASLAEDQKYLADLGKNCDTKAAEWDERKKTRAEELVALADTIRILNDDDALELFKKTLPGSSSFLEVPVSSKAARTRALALLQNARRRGAPQLDFIALALHGKTVGFEKVISMIDSMVGVLKKEQGDDDAKKGYCLAEFDESDDKKKGLERAVSDAGSSIEAAKDAIATLTDEMAALEAGIKALDKAVAEATEQRKNEHSEFVELMASDKAAKDLLGVAKNRLAKFYNPKLYNPPPKQELSAEDRVFVSMGGTAPPTAAPGGIAGTGISLAQVSAHGLLEDAPPPPPETFGAYTKKAEETTGVLAMIDMLVRDLTKEMTEAGVEEKDAQSEYETLMQDSAAKRVADSKSLQEKAAAKAGVAEDLNAHSETKKATTAELLATVEYISSLHGECDWLLKNFEARKTARAGEVDSLVNAKAVLSGADFS